VVELSPLSDRPARNGGDRIGVDGSAQRLAVARVDALPAARLFLPGPQKRGTGGTLSLIRFLVRPGPPASCPSGCATGSSTLPPRSPKARDRGHPQLDKIPRETGAARRGTGGTLSLIRFLVRPGAPATPGARWGPRSLSMNWKRQQCCLWLLEKEGAPQSRPRRNRRASFVFESQRLFAEVLGNIPSVPRFPSSYCHHRSPTARDRWHPHLGWREPPSPWPPASLNQNHLSKLITAQWPLTSLCTWNQYGSPHRTPFGPKSRLTS